MTQQALSDATCIHVSQIRRYEGGRSEPTLENLRKLACGLGATGDSLLFNRDERGPPPENFRMRRWALDRLDDDEVRAVEQLLDRHAPQTLRAQGRRHRLTRPSY